eukprot:5147112-Ditylum_brightwellii.AAC.1
MIGAYTRVILALSVKSKYCGIYHLYEKQDLLVPAYECVYNYKGISKGMEAQKALELTLEAKRKHSQLSAPPICPTKQYQAYVEPT